MRYHTLEGSPYMLPCDGDELNRLELQHKVYTQISGRVSQMPLDELLYKTDSKVLDLGCGTGSWARDVAIRYPQAEVHALDMVKTIFDEIEKLPNITFTIGNVLEKLPYPDNYFDAVFQRLMILGIPKDKWEYEIQEITRVTKPGGFIEFVEIDSVFRETGPYSTLFFGGLVLALETRGLDIEIGQNLPKLMQKAGLHIDGKSTFTIALEGEIGVLNLKNYLTLSISLKPWLTKTFGMTNEEYEEYLDNIKQESLQYQSYHGGISVVGQKIALPEIIAKPLVIVKDVVNETSEKDVNRRTSYHPIDKTLFFMPENLDRLEIRHRVNTHVFGSLFHMPIDDILTQSGKRILDVGCGPGSWIRDMAIKYPMTEFFGILQWLDEIKELKRVTKLNGYIEFVEIDSDIQNLGPTGSYYFKGLNLGGPFRGICIGIVKELPEKIKEAGLQIESEIIRSFPNATKPSLLKTFQMTSEEYDIMTKNLNNEFVLHQAFFNGIAVVVKKIENSNVKLSKSPKIVRDRKKGSKRRVEKLPSSAFHHPEETSENNNTSEEYYMKNAALEISNMNNKHNIKAAKVDSTNTVNDSVKLNEQIATNWKPERRHSLREDARVDYKRRFHAVTDSPYPLPADIEEQDRLEIQHLIFKHAFGGLFTMPVHEILSKQETLVLDVGCGPGSWAREVASKYPKSTIHAVDMAMTLFDGIDTFPNITFKVGNVLERLPYPDNHFDVVFQRLLTGGIPKIKWNDVIKELHRVTKPGGFIELVEPDITEKLGPTGQILIGGIYKALELRGLDPKFGKLFEPELLI
ncbi:hypothetical protein HK096_008539 [Nowakowskiella sp. JEL0078]|nr:hypothetical protein HK096_008539 [Nowakowskiella sp. JEL0078]